MNDKILQQTYYTTPDGEMFAYYEDAETHCKKLKQEEKSPGFTLLHDFIQSLNFDDDIELTKGILEYKHEFLELLAELCHVKFTHLRSKNATLVFNTYKNMWELTYKSKFCGSTHTLDEALELLEAQIVG